MHSVQLLRRLLKNIYTAITVQSVRNVLQKLIESVRIKEYTNNSMLLISWRKEHGVHDNSRVCGKMGNLSEKSWNFK